MNYSKRQADPRRHFAGISFVFLFHAFIVYALVTGLAKKVVDVVRAPIDTKVVEEVKKLPPPPEIVVPPPPRLEAPPPPYIPPPEVQIATPPPVQATISATTPTPPPVQQSIVPLPPAAAPAPVGPPSAAAYCNKRPAPEIPGVDFAGKLSLSARATIRNNRIVQVEIIPGSFSGSSDRKVQRAFANAVTAAMLEYGCVGDNVVVEQPFSFTIH
ncbi:hypothetical protein [Piscinibacter sp.]|jgi:protein TonB|uniref:hypothetical protein n=1 Tax=Piscinibacter sp. TaxID=1903157 RepID=UPI002F42CE5C